MVNRVYLLTLDNKVNMDDVIINCDWLQYSVMLESDEPEFECPEGFRLEMLQGNNIFRYRCLVSDSAGRKWLTLLWSPYSSVLNSRLMTVQVANLLLYYNSIQVSFHLLKSIVNCRFNSCGRVDICCDFQMCEEKLEVLKHLNSGHYYVQGKSEGSTWWHSANEVTENATYLKSQLHCLSWGSKKSDIKVKCYNKSREINAKEEQGQCNKPYIRELWEQAGWDIGMVWRLEFSLSGTGKLRWKNKVISLEDVSSSVWLQRVFYSLYGTRFIVRENQGKREGHKNEDEEKEFLSLPKESDILCRSLGAMNGMSCSDAVKVLRKLIAQLSSPAVASSRKVSAAVAAAASSVVENAGLSAYFLSKFGSDYRSFLREAVEMSGEGVFEVDGAPRKAWE